MTLLTPPFALGANGQLLSGKLLRLSQGAAFRGGASGVLGISGTLYGAPNTMGELSLPNNTTLRVQPFRAVIQQSQDATAGQYIAVNDAQVDLGAADGFSAQDATQFRRAYVLVSVDDSQVSGVASSATTDRARLYILPGALAASSGAAALPAVPNNSLLLGEMLIPPVGQNVTITSYQPRTTTRGGILPVIADGSTVAGHDGAAPLHDGQYRHHPTKGLQGSYNGGWFTGTGDRPVASLTGSGTQTITTSVTQTLALNVAETYDSEWFSVDTINGRINFARSGWYQCHGGAGLAGSSSVTRRIALLARNGAQINSAQGLLMANGATNTVTMATPTRLLYMAAGDYLHLLVYQDTGASLGSDKANAHLTAIFVHS